MADRSIDIRGLLCPLTWARVRKELLGMKPGQRLHVVLDHRPALPDIKRNAADLGHEVDRVEERAGFWELEIELGPLP
jgi:TusA-related sulfurtransferase